MPMSSTLSADALTYYLTTDSLVIARPTTWFIGLHNADPGRTGTNEIDTGDDANYVRKAVTFAVSDVGSDNIYDAANTADVTFDAAASGASYTITHISVWSAASGGDLLATLQLAVPLPITVGSVTNFAAGDITIRGV